MGDSKKRPLISRVLKVNNGLLSPDADQVLSTNAAKYAALVKRSKHGKRRVARMVELIEQGANRRAKNAHLPNDLSRPTRSSLTEPIVLYVRRGKLTGLAQQCSSCRMNAQPIWRYSASNRGAVFLCNQCKTAAFERSFGHADAMPLVLDRIRKQSS